MCTSLRSTSLFATWKRSSTSFEVPTPAALARRDDLPLGTPLILLSVGCIVVALLALAAMVATLVICRRSGREADAEARLVPDMVSNYSRSVSTTSTSCPGCEKKLLSSEEKMPDIGLRIEACA
jgi:hypothetical protein